MTGLSLLAAFLGFAVATAAETDFVAKLPLAFEENRGQAGEEVRFTVKGDGFRVAFARSEIALSLKDASIRTWFRGAKQNPILRADERLEGVVNYVYGPDADAWITGIPTFGRIRYEQIYPGIDVVYYGNNSAIEYDFVVGPGGDPKSIAMRFEGMDTLALDRDGNLLLSAGNSSVIQRKPIAYQEKERVEVQYRLVDEYTVAFDVGSYDSSRTLVIDPILSYSTFLGGSNGDDDARSITTDESGNVYIAGATTSTNFTTRNPYQGTAGNPDPEEGFNDAFVTKLNATGSALVFSTYLGGSGDDQAVSVGVDSAGNVAIAGVTTSTNFPTSVGAIRRTCNVAGNGTCQDGFVTKLNPSGSAFVFSTYLGGSGDDEVRSLAVDSSASTYVAGRTASTNFPMASAISTNSSSGAFVSKLNSTGGIVYSTYFSAGTGTTEIRGIAVDTSGSAYVTGSTPASGSTATDVFVAKLNVAGSALVFTSYIRGTRDESGNSVAVDSSANAYVTGQTNSMDFTTAGVLQSTFGGGPIFRSGDGGTNWIAASGGVNRSSFYAFAMTAGPPLVLYAGADDGSTGGVFRSADAGATWTAASTGLTDRRIHALAVDPITPATVYAGTFATGVFKSTNSGATWAGTTLNSGLVTSIVVDPGNSDIVFASIDGGGVYKSTNGGASWAAVNSGLSSIAVRSVVMHPTNSATLFAATGSGIYRTTNGGSSWVSVSTGLFDSDINAVAIDPRNPSIIYAATNSFGIFRSTNSGVFWFPANAGLTGSLVSALAVDSTSGALYAAVGEANVSRVFKSTTGTTWTSTGLSSARITNLMVDRGDASNVYATSTGGADAFVAKWNSSGTLAFATYLGAFADDTGNAIAVDGSGNSYVTGNTSSSNFPLSGAMQAAFGGGTGVSTDAFVAKVNSTGTRLAYSSYVGGSANDFGKAIAVDTSGSAYVAGQTGSADFPVQSALAPTRPGLLDAFIAKVAETSTTPFVVPIRGGYSVTSQGSGTGIDQGYVRVVPNPASTTPGGMAIFGFRQNNVLVSEAAVPASATLRNGRIYAEVGGGVNTGIAIVNPNSQSVTLTFYFTDEAGQNFGNGTTVLAANSHMAAFLSDPPFNGGSSIQGTFTFSANSPVAVTALRGRTNTRSEFLLTTLPVADTSVIPLSEMVLFSHFADGGGWTTQFVLTNPTDAIMNGTLDFYGPGSSAAAGAPVAISIGNQIATSFSYSIPARSSRSFRTSGTSAGLQTGSVRMTPAGISRTPSAVGIFTFYAGDVAVSEAGVPALRTSTAFRLYVESSGNFLSGEVDSTQTGVAIANSSGSPATINLELTTLTGSPTGMSGTLTIPANGQIATFLGSIPGFAQLPNPFQGVLRVSTTASGVSMVGLRGRNNERRELLIATTPPTIEGSAPVTTELFFPHFADGGGYTTQFILFNGTADQTAAGSLRFFSRTGDTLSLPVR